jgi:hypothetical protein
MADLQQQPSAAQTVIPPQIVTDFEKVLRDPEGKRVVLWLLEQCGVYRNAFTGNADATNERLGEINIGLKLISKLHEVSPSEYARLLLWNAQRLETEKAKVYVVDAE